MSVPGGRAERRGEGLELEVSTVEIFVGLDWGEQHHQIHALDGGDGTTFSLRVPHDRSGLERLRVALAGLGEPSEVGVATIPRTRFTTVGPNGVVIPTRHFPPLARVEAALPAPSRLRRSRRC